MVACSGAVGKPGEPGEPVSPVPVPTDRRRPRLWERSPCSDRWTLARANLKNVILELHGRAGPLPTTHVMSQIDMAKATVAVSGSEGDHHRCCRWLGDGDGNGYRSGRELGDSADQCVTVTRPEPGAISVPPMGRNDDTDENRSRAVRLYDSDHASRRSKASMEDVSAAMGSEALPTPERQLRVRPTGDESGTQTLTVRPTLTSGTRQSSPPAVTMSTISTDCEPWTMMDRRMWGVHVLRRGPRSMYRRYDENSPNQLTGRSCS